MTLSTVNSVTACIVQAEDKDCAEEDMMELIDQIVKNLGINEDQAKGGAGLFLKLAKNKLGAEEFSEVQNAIPETDDVIRSAPESGGIAGALGGIASSLGADKLGNLATLSGGFSKLGLDKGMIGKFAPIILSFVQSKGGDTAKGILEKVIH